MPAIRIETRRCWIGDRRPDIIGAVQRALLTGLEIPNDDCCTSLVEYDADAIIVPSGNGPAYLVIEIKLFSGRPLDAKRRLYAAIVDELSVFGIPAGDIETILVEIDPVHWGLRGLPASELDLDFKTDA